MFSKYMLWTDASSREFIAEHYPWFLETFDGYRYPIQRADAIRYFVLYHYGGVYIDLDIGCLRPADPLLVYPIILPKTIPVGVSNDLMFAEKGHPFLKQTIQNLRSFDYSWLLNYPTVMFSTGPMFLSVQYGIYARENLDIAISQIRILPKSLYGKNANDLEAPRSFFSHFYGSSWHSDDAAFIAFLSTWGKSMMWLGLFILIVGSFRLFSKPRRSSITRIGRYDIVLPRLSRSGRWHFHLGRNLFAFSFPSSPICSEPSSPTGDLSFLQIPLDSDAYLGRPSSYIMETFRQVRNRIRIVRERYTPPNSPVTPIRPRQSNRGILFFLPAVFTTQSPSIELQAGARPHATRTVSASSVCRHMNGSTKGDLFQRDVESGLMQISDNQESRLDWDNVSECTPSLSIPSHSRSGSEDTAVGDGGLEEAWFSSQHH
jgi:hypothetical protein